MPALLEPQDARRRHFADLHGIDLVNRVAPFFDCGRMTVGELIEVLSEYAESEDYDPASPVYLLSGNETPRPLTEVEPLEDDDTLILVAA